MCDVAVSERAGGAHDEPPGNRDACGGEQAFPFAFGEQHGKYTMHYLWHAVNFGVESIAEEHAKRRVPPVVSGQRPGADNARAEVEDAS